MLANSNSVSCHANGSFSSLTLLLATVREHYRQLDSKLAATTGGKFGQLDSYPKVWALFLDFGKLGLELRNLS